MNNKVLVGVLLLGVLVLISGCQQEKPSVGQAYTGTDSTGDDDGDGVINSLDNCPDVSNFDQADHDMGISPGGTTPPDDLGDACDPNDDNDDYLDEIDACPRGAVAWDADGADADGDGCLDSEGDVDFDGDGVNDWLEEDLDDDNDAVLDTDDVFPLDATESIDTDDDGTGNNADADDDNDSKLVRSDNCLIISNTNQQDTDTDGVGDACDTCPDYFNPDQGSNCGACRAPGFSLTAADIDATISLTCSSSTGQRAVSQCYCAGVVDNDNDCLDNLQASLDAGNFALDYQSSVEYYGCAPTGACETTTRVACDEGSVCSLGKCTTVDYCRADAYCPPAAEFSYLQNGIQYVQSSTSVCQNQVCVQQRSQVCANKEDCLAAEGNTCFNGRCTFASCGENQRELGEQCDDGNVLDGDGCSSLCTIEDESSCVGEIGEVSYCRESTAMFFADLQTAFKDIKEALGDTDLANDAAAKETFINSLKEAVARLFR